MSAGCILRSFLFTFCAARFVVFSATDEGTGLLSISELTVSMTNDLHLVCRAELWDSSKLVLTIQILGSFKPESGNGPHYTSVDTRRHTADILKQNPSSPETQTKITLDEKSRNLQHDDTRTFATPFEVFASGDSSGVWVSPYLANFMASSHVNVTGKVKGTPKPWLQLALLDASYTYYGRYMCCISYLDNAADDHTSLWQSEVIIVSAETVFPQQKVRFKIIPQSTHTSCIYYLPAGSTLQEMTIQKSSSGVIMSVWSTQDDRLNCEEGLICHHITHNASQFSLHVHCFSEKSLCETDASDLMCIVRVKKNDVIVQKSSGDKRLNEVDPETDRSALTAILGVVCSVVLLGIVVIIVCVLAIKRKRRKSWIPPKAKVAENGDDFDVSHNGLLQQNNLSGVQLRASHIEVATPINSENNSEDEEIPETIERALGFSSQARTMSRSADLTLVNGCHAE